LKKDVERNASSDLTSPEDARGVEPGVAMSGSQADSADDEKEVFNE
jgi:hypothetical protein